MFGGGACFLMNSSTQAQSLESRDRLIRSSQKKDSIELNADYVGLVKNKVYHKIPKLSKGETLNLNTVDTTELCLVPMIGPSFARRIVKYRQKLGGFYTVLQLQEIYGMTYDRYKQIKTYFRIERAPIRRSLSLFSYDSIPRHPYLNYKQRNALSRILYREGHLNGWQQLVNTGYFTQDDSVRLSHYFIFSRSK